MRLRSSLLRALLLPTAIACAPPEPPDPALVAEWATLTAASGADARQRARADALGALAMYEAFAVGNASLRSIAGQVNGLWNVPAGDGGIDAAIAAAEAQRVVLDSVLRDAGTRRRVDSLAVAQRAARRAAGVSEQVDARSASHGSAIGRAILTLAASDAQRTLVLRHPQECAFGAKATGVVPQGAAAPAPPAGLPVLAAVEQRLIDALVAADSTATRDNACVRNLVRGRVKTRD